MGFASEHRGLASIDLNAPSMKRLLKLSGKIAPIGASPGELRLWLKMNGLLDENAHGSISSHQSKQHRATNHGLLKRQACGARQLPPIQGQQRESTTMVGCTSGKTGGKRGGRAGRSGSIDAAHHTARMRSDATHEEVLHINQEEEADEVVQLVQLVQPPAQLFDHQQLLDQQQHQQLYAWQQQQQLYMQSMQQHAAWQQQHAVYQQQQQAFAPPQGWYAPQ